ncbi:DUF1878 family protein [Bacillus tuaregi]|uniref:DUF1878 family protein n=1 Tax=Bacillus tuaregi TaxID=1816695 RepID=UPI0008F8F9A3|nr:DUF1878 family protein [Bacillus tuaregi]
MDLAALLERIKRLEYHQSLLLEMNQSTKHALYRFIIERGIGEKEAQKLFELCDELSMELEEQKAEGFVHFHPLFTKFTMKLHTGGLPAEDVIAACITQGLYLPLMTELKKYL